MGNVLVVAEHFNGTLRKVTFPTVTFAQNYTSIKGGEVIGLLLGSGIADVGNELAPYGVNKVIVLDDSSLENPLSETYGPAIAAVATEIGAEVVCAPASMQGKDYMPKVADILGAGMVTDAIEVWEEDGTVLYKRPMWAGSVNSVVAVDTPVAVVTVRTTAFDAVAAGEAAPVDQRQDGQSSEVTTFIRLEEVKSDRPDLNDASVVVAGGRGMKDKERFNLLEVLADIFGGAVGASRAAVDAGMAPNDWQIGQTGKIVAPDLYFAVGISGAIQHVAGMKGAKTIVAINKDAEAPIFQVSDYGLVVDAMKVLPEITEKIQAILNS